MVAAAVGVLAIAGSGALAFDDMASSGAGAVEIVGTSAITFDEMTAAATGATLHGSAAVTFEDMTASGSGASTIEGAGAFTLADMIAAGSGDLTISGDGAATLDAMTASGVGALDIAGTGAATFDAMTAAAVGALAIAGSGAVTFDDLTCSAAGTVSDALGSELMTNGPCSSATGWNDLGTGTWNVSGGTMNATVDVLLVSNDGTETGVEEGKVYRCGYTIVSVAVAGDGVAARIGLSAGVTRTGPGTYSEDLLADTIGDEGSWRLAAIGSFVSMVFDNFTCREVL